MGWGNWSGFAPYVSKAQKIRQAEKARAALAKKGIILEPVIINCRDITRTWWGKTWAQNLERYADYSNRIPRGRSYVRTGAVLDLKISQNTITALVSGSCAQPYKINIGIASLNKNAENALMEKSRSSLASMQSLLAGEFPTDLKEEFFKQGTGLFPSPNEIKLNCSCPDWADMCKHVAAALYGTAARLDEKPELFFLLRGIKIDDFVGKMVKQESEKMLKKSKAKTERVLTGNAADMSSLFGIQMESVPIAKAEVKPHVKVKAKENLPVKRKKSKREKRKTNAKKK
jgi:uncharacterized Zn finger protein